MKSKKEDNYILTTRDMEVVEFVKKYKVATTGIIQKVFFPSIKTCRRRLKLLVEAKQLKHIRDSINAEYIYYVKPPKQFKHALAVVSVYANLNKKYIIQSFTLEPVLGKIRPDAMFAYIDRGYSKIGFLEVEISHKAPNIKKYQEFNGIIEEGKKIDKFTLFIFQHDKLSIQEMTVK